MFHTRDSSQWVDRTTSLSALPCIISLCTAWGEQAVHHQTQTDPRGGLPQIQTSRGGCSANPPTSHRPTFCSERRHLQAKTPTATVIDLHREAPVRRGRPTRGMDFSRGQRSRYLAQALFLLPAGS